MLLTRPQKEQLVAAMEKSLVESKMAVLINFQGLKVKEIQDLKKKLREKGIGFQIIKNSLFKIALKNASLKIEDSVLDQPLAIIWGLEDEVEPARLIVEFGKTTEALKIIGGIINKIYTDKSIIQQLASLPRRQELYAHLVGSLNAPMFRLVNVLQGNLRSLVYILKQYQESKI